MNVWTRKALALSAAIAGMAAVGIAYERCVQPQEAVWNEDTPVHWSPDYMPLRIGGEVYGDALKKAVDLWNGQANCELFSLDWNPTITVRQGAIEVGQGSEDWGAGAFVDKYATRGEIVVFVPLMVGTDLQVLHHEMGHILGLAHDRAWTMKPNVKEEIGGGQRKVRASDKDIAALNDRYCGVDE